LAGLLALITFASSAVAMTAGGSSTPTGTVTSALTAQRVVHGDGGGHHH
jgi:hypothetical protein